MNLDKVIQLHNEAHNAMHETYHANAGMGGKVRAARGNLVETIVGMLWKDIHPDNTVNHAKHPVTRNGFTINKALDCNLYKAGNLVGMVECKAYLDSCYLERAVSDAEELKHSGYNVPLAVVALEDSLDSVALQYWLSKGSLDKVFFLVDGKRSSSKPLYQREYFKPIQLPKLYNLIDWMRGL